MNKDIIALKQKIAELEKENSVLRKLAERDELTGLYNRAGFSARISKIIEEYKKEQNLAKKGIGRKKIISNLSIIFSDFDYLKKINDLYGHEAGDKAIKVFAKFLEDNVRPIDYVGRWGGDEFVMALVNADCRQANLRIRSIVKKMESLAVIFGGKKIQMGASFGSASMEDDCDLKKPITSFAQLVKLADKRMYAYKKSSR